MCGIFGFVSRRERPASLVLDGLCELEYRGYDSWGVAVATGGRVDVRKSVGRVTGAQTDLPDARAALGHTRWATHGGVTQANAHPHGDCSGRLALIHNGIVENHQELRYRLSRSHRFASQTDTEVLVHLLEEHLEHEPDLLAALLTVFRQVEGLSAVAVLDAAAGQVAVAKNGSPLVLGWSQDGCFLASDAHALLPHTRDVTFLDDGQAAGLTGDGVRVVDLRTGAARRPSVRRLAWERDEAGLNGYAHFMAKEIHEQPEVLERLAADCAPAAAELAKLIRASRDVYLIGCGTAYHAALSSRYALAEMAGTASTAVPASEMGLLFPMIGPDSLIVVFSQSGETIDVLEAVRCAQARGARICAIVNVEGSSLDRLADLSIHLGCGQERCVLATKTYSAMLAALHLTARALGGDVPRGVEEVDQAARSVRRLLQREQADGRIAETARRIAEQQHLFVLGRHRSYPLALESALKIKEVSYMHAEGFAAGELKHGVIALVTFGTPCVILAPDPDFRKEILAAAAEVQARGAFTIGISPTEEAEMDVTIPVSEGSGPYETSVVSQLLAYNLALLRGCDPDKPRNLAKSVTVK